MTRTQLQGLPAIRGYTKKSNSETSKSSTTLIARLLELSITYSTFTLGCSLILVLIVLEVAVAIKYVW